MKEETVTLYRPCGEKELELVKSSNYKSWPPRLPDQPIFYPVTNEKYAIEVTKWNVTREGIGYVTKFEVLKHFMEQYKIQTVGGHYHTEWWVPSEDLEALNKNIIGEIEVIGEYTSI